MNVVVKPLCAGLALALLTVQPLLANTCPIEVPFLEGKVKAGTLPPMTERLPESASSLPFALFNIEVGKYGGDWRWLIARNKDTRYQTVNGYARLIGYDRNLELKADILESFEVEDGRVFTFTLRQNHRWSDGTPFTTEDFRYWWEDVANHKELNPSGPPPELSVDGELPKVEFLSKTQVRFSWSKVNPVFLARIAGASPLYIYRPAHYMKQFHAKYTDPAKLDELAKEGGRHNWAALHNAYDNLYNFDNPDLPTLEPWQMVSRPPTTRFIAERNPYFHRVDPRGCQLPYMDRVIMDVSAGGLISAKAGSGDVDLQARGIQFTDYSFLRGNQKSHGKIKVNLWTNAKAADFALYPNLNTKDPAWRQLFRKTQFRRALSLGIDRLDINESFFFGLGRPVNNSLLPTSPLYDESFAQAWTEFDLNKANAILDGLGLFDRSEEGYRMLAKDRQMDLIIETAGEDPREVDILQLIKDTWAQLGIKVYIKPSQRDLLRNRIFSGETVMSVWTGWENGLARPEMNPGELAPTMQVSLQWPAWGQFYETGGNTGELPDLPIAQTLLDLDKAWREAKDLPAKQEIWQKMLKIHADEVFIIGVVNGTMQPIVSASNMVNLPEKGQWAWDPGSNFGMYWPDTFWYRQEAK